MEPGARTEEPGVTGRVIQATQAILGATRNELHFSFEDAGLFLFCCLSYSFLTLRFATNIAH